MVDHPDTGMPCDITSRSYLAVQMHQAKQGIGWLGIDAGHVSDLMVAFGFVTLVNANSIGPKVRKVCSTPKLQQKFETGFFVCRKACHLSRSRGWHCPTLHSLVVYPRKRHRAGGKWCLPFRCVGKIIDETHFLRVRHI